MQPWEHPVPPVLYKYLPPERLHVLSDCRVRFSQRTAFQDVHELQPEYAIFGTASEIWRYAISTGFPLTRGGLTASVMAAAMAGNPKVQKIGVESLQKNIQVRNELGIFCLTETTDCNQMWTEYADKGRGFIIGFDTGHSGFEQLKGRGHLGKVSYSDEPIGSALGSLWNDDAVGALFRKRMKYAFEREWRSSACFIGSNVALVMSFCRPSIRRACAKSLSVRIARWKRVYVSSSRPQTGTTNTFISSRKD